VGASAVGWAGTSKAQVIVGSDAGVRLHRARVAGRCVHESVECVRYANGGPGSVGPGGIGAEVLRRLGSGRGGSWAKPLGGVPRGTCPPPPRQEPDGSGLPVPCETWQKAGRQWRDGCIGEAQGREFLPALSRVVAVSRRLGRFSELGIPGSIQGGESSLKSRRGSATTIRRVLHNALRATRDSVRNWAAPQGRVGCSRCHGCPMCVRDRKAGRLVCQELRR
jgi:hypothetical protein